MKRSLQALAALTLAASLLSSQAADSTAGIVDFGPLNPVDGKGKFVEVNIRGNLLAMAATLAEKAEPEAADLLRRIQLVRVNVLELDDSNRQDTTERIKKIRAELEAKGWERIVTAQEKNEDVRVYVRTRGTEAIEGIVVTVLSGDKEAVLVNIVGDVQPAKIAMIGERLNIDPLKRLGREIPR